MTDSLLVLVGTRNRASSPDRPVQGRGLLAYRFDPASEAVEAVGETTEVDNPTFLAVSAGGRVVYATSEMPDWPEGKVTALDFDARSGTFREINRRWTLGSSTAYATLTRDGRRLLIANYGGDVAGPDQSVVVFGVREDGGLTEVLDSAQHEGTGLDPERQSRSHPHSVVEVPGTDLLLAADLGTDSVTAYRLSESGKLDGVAETALKPGSGPRHIAVHPNGRLIAVLNELDSTMVTLALDQRSGALAFRHAMPMVPPEARQKNKSADVTFSPDGRYLYGSNRGHESVSIFSVDADSGRLGIVGLAPSGGLTPRSICLTPSGRHLLIANQNGHCFIIYRRDPQTGRLSESGRSIEVGSPMCVRIVGA